MPGAVTLTVGPWRAVIAPDLGACILSLSHGGRPLLRAATEAALAAGEVRLTGGYPMLPFANRIAAGRFLFAGRWHQLRANAPALVGPHALHGLGWQSAWQVIGQTEDGLSLRLVHRPTADGDWPYAFTARMEYRLSSAGLTVALQLTNDSGGMAPAGLGLHPNFRRSPDILLRFSALSHWQPGPDGFPASVSMPPEPDFRHGRPLDDRLLDGDFPGWSGIAHINGLIPDLLVSLRADRLFGTLRLFTPPGRDFFGLEPVSHGANALNQPELPPMAILAPGASLSGTISILAEPLA